MQKLPRHGFDPCHIKYPLLQTRIPPRLEHTSSGIALLLHNPEGAHRCNTYWDVCGFFVREMFHVLPCESIMSSVSPYGLASCHRFPMPYISFNKLFFGMFSDEGGNEASQPLRVLPLRHARTLAGLRPAQPLEFG
jgi:hypothetical protein